jgi:hypothetical protein
MPLVEFEPTTPVSERVKTVHALDHAATGVGLKAEVIPVTGRAVAQAVSR